MKFYTKISLLAMAQIQTQNTSVFLLRTRICIFTLLSSKITLGFYLSTSELMLSDFFLFAYSFPHSLFTHFQHTHFLSLPFPAQSTHSVAAPTQILFIILHQGTDKEKIRKEDACLHFE